MIVIYNTDDDVLATTEVFDTKQQALDWIQVNGGAGNYKLYSLCD